MHAVMCDVRPLLASRNSCLPAAPGDARNHHRQPNPMPPIGPVRVQVVSQRISGQNPEHPDPDGSVQNAVILLVAFAEDGLFHGLSMVAGSGRGTQPRGRNALKPLIILVLRRGPEGPLYP